MTNKEQVHVDAIIKYMYKRIRSIPLNRDVVVSFLLPNIDLPHNEIKTMFDLKECLRFVVRSIQSIIVHTDNSTYGKDVNEHCSSNKPFCLHCINTTNHSDLSKPNARRKIYTFSSKKKE